MARPARIDWTTAPGRRSRRWPAFLAGAVLGAAVLAALVVVVGLPWAVGHRRDLPLERFYGNAAVSVASRLQAGSPSQPLPTDSRALATGRDAYTGSCAQCHGATGDGKGIFGQATYPPATDLTNGDAKEKSDAQLFWITKNGLSFTGMPAFGGQYDDQTLWDLVAYVRALQNGQAAPAAVPAASAAQLAQADPHGDAAQRGAAVYFAQGCQTCHGPVGDAPGELALGRGGREAQEAVRRGRRGMPAYGPDLISDGQLTDLEAYLATFPGRGR